MKERVFVLTTVHNSISHTKKLVNCLKKQTYKNMKIVIVDDGSTDDTRKYLRGFKDIDVVCGDGNLWWTGGLNRGVEKILPLAKGEDYILTINNDCVFNKNFVKQLVGASKENDRSITGSLEIDVKNKNKIISGLIKVDWQTGIFSNALKNKKTLKKYFYDANTLQTKGTLIPIEVFNKVGLFDEKHFPHYASDYEFFIRAKKAGFNLLVSSQAKVYCDQSRTGVFDEKGKITPDKLLELAFSRKSQINFIDHINLIRFCCPVRYKLKNYFILFKKILYFVSRIPPFLFIRRIFYKDDK